jgi:hypothetical protein
VRQKIGQRYYPTGENHPNFRKNRPEVTGELNGMSTQVIIGNNTWGSIAECSRETLLSYHTIANFIKFNKLPANNRNNQLAIISLLLI